MKKYFPGYSIIIFLLLGLMSCSSTTDKEYWNEALQNMRGFKYKESILSFEKLVEEYPQSPYAIKALQELSNIYQELKIPGLTQSESMNKAIFYNKRIMNEYPKSPDAPKALFRIGYIEANELKDLESASRDYNAFLTKFPNHELAPSVKYELEHLGVDPEEILNQKLSNTGNDRKKSGL